MLEISGPTASGKTAIAIEAAERLNAEIISTDSRQFYRFLDIGTAKPIFSELQRVPHHFIDFLDPDEPLSAGEFSLLAVEKIRRLSKNSKEIIITGGSGLFTRAVTHYFTSPAPPPKSIRKKIEKYVEDKDSSSILGDIEKTHPGLLNNAESGNKRRLTRLLETIHEGESIRPGFGKLPRRFRIFSVLLMRERAELYERIERRVDAMIENGLVEETIELVEKGYANCRIVRETIGYREMLEWIEKKVDFNEAVERIKRNTRRYAKRQITWFNKFGGMKIMIDKHDTDEIVVSKILNLYAEWKESGGRMA